MQIGPITAAIISLGFIFIIIVPVFIFGVDRPHFFYIYLLAGVVSLVAAIILFEKEVMLRIKYVAGEVDKIRQGGSLKNRLAVKGADELSHVAAGINRMLESLEKEHRHLMESEEKFRAITHTALDGFLITDLEGNFIYLNEAYCRMIGYDRTELLKMGIKDVEASENPEAIAHHLKIIVEKGADSFETRHRCKDGRLIDLEINVNFLKKEQELFAFIRNITEKKRAAEELKNAYEKIKKTQAYLIQSEKMAALGEFAMGLAHEINNPLGNISSAAQLCLNHANQNDFKEFTDKYLNIILKNAETSSLVVRQLLNFAKPDGVVFKTGKIQDVLEGSLELVSPQFLNRNIKVVKKISSEIPQFSFDHLRLREAFLNFLLNALDALPDGGQLEISADFDARKKQVAVIFLDNGSGIDRENLGKIFSPFFSTKASGVGLGMAMSQQIIMAHKGDIVIDSEPGRGTKITVTLPVKV